MNFCTKGPGSKVVSVMVYYLLQWPTSCSEVRKHHVVIQSFIAVMASADCRVSVFFRNLIGQTDFLIVKKDDMNSTFMLTNSQQEFIPHKWIHFSMKYSLKFNCQISLDRQKSWAAHTFVTFFDCRRREHVFIRLKNLSLQKQPVQSTLRVTSK